MIIKTLYEQALNAKTLSEFSCGEQLKDNDNYERKILNELRRNKDHDYLYDYCWIERMIKLLNPNEVLIIKKIDDYFKIFLSTYNLQKDKYIKWCKKNNYDDKNAIYLRKFMKEERIIWL